jgi:hypothetical protein
MDMQVDQTRRNQATTGIDDDFAIIGTIGFRFPYIQNPPVFDHDIPT